MSSKYHIGIPYFSGEAVEEENFHEFSSYVANQFWFNGAS